MWYIRKGNDVELYSMHRLWCRIEGEESRLHIFFGLDKIYEEYWDNS